MVAVGLIVVALFATSAAAKACMDVSKFIRYDYAFAGFPEWFRRWMDREGTFPVLKIDDGWHAMQAAMFLALGGGYYLAGATLHPAIGAWAFPASWLARTVIHGLVFELLYREFSKPPKNPPTA